jgi:DNA-binding response OmpR family regulator
VAYRILVVEDEADLRELFDVTQRWAGHHVETAVDSSTYRRARDFVNC